MKEDDALNRILLVEDDSTLAMGIEYSLRNEGYEVDLANNLALGRKFADEKDYCLIILDINLPDGSGYELCKHIRKSKNVPVIFLTALDEEVNVVMGLDIGGDDYITKPFRIKELLSRINAVMRRYHQIINQETQKSQKYQINAPANRQINNLPDAQVNNAEELILESKDIIVNKIENKVMVKDEYIFLTPSEYKLLLILMNNSQCTLIRSVILEKLWDIEGDFIDDNTLSVYIRRLREKIEKDSSNPEYIITIRGIGYKWDMPVRRK